MDHAGGRPYALARWKGPARLGSVLLRDEELVRGHEETQLAVDGPAGKRQVAGLVCKLKADARSPDLLRL